MKRVATMCMLCVFALSLLTTRAHALGEFKTAFQKKYVDDGGAELKAGFKAASCNACHVKEQKKTVRNTYGEELAKLIEGSADARLKAAAKEGGDAARKAELEKLIEEVEKAFEEVAKMKNKNGDVYGDLIKKGDMAGLAVKP